MFSIKTILFGISLMVFGGIMQIDPSTNVGPAFLITILGFLLSLFGYLFGLIKIFGGRSGDE
ncbi:hypothetical protein LGQ02_11380 [Bacillus shivajii]|uniref:hypothetical protein n=1 Tax=Bacillus shivajii TaxID=1983719 RepID=UPI001CFAAEC5|nr:hypothetical protein [Bacillus shivajii]UCZ51479.1 hypothetical protein LGQ02_11380 [Bacillus shivajii]